ncbi:MAG: hypothetical protein D6785_03625 [Planctomycetota bacterium]|nr:MAG: hypothetical protein D6785_03625 [Planctomycetota bacterium]
MTSGQRFLLLFIGFFLFLPVIWLQQKVVKERKKNIPPSMELLYTHQLDITFGQDALLADIYWIQCNLYLYHHIKRDDRHFKYLESLYQKITDLDPYFIKAYIYGSYFLTGLAFQDDPAERLLMKGWKKTHHWQIASELGAFYQIRKNNLAKALLWYEIAAKDPRSPKLFQMIIAFMKVRNQGDKLDMLKTSLEIALARYENAKKERNETYLSISRRECLDLLEKMEKEAKKENRIKEIQKYLKLKQELQQDQGIKGK